MERSRPAQAFRIDTFDLRLFAAIVLHGSITAGARGVHLSLAAASTRLLKLEHAIGASLLLRSKRGVALTDAGRTLMLHAGRLEQELEALHAAMAAHARGVRSTVRVMCNTSAMTEHLPRLIGRFLAEHAGIDIELKELGSQDVLRAMRQERADIGVIADYVGAEGVSTRKFRDDPLVAILPAGQGRVMRGKVDFANLMDKPFVGLPEDSGLSGFLRSQAERHGRSIHHRVRVRSLDAVVGLVADGVGVAVVPEATAIRLKSRRLAVRELGNAWAARKLLLCTAKNAPLGSGATALLRFLAAPAS